MRSASGSSHAWGWTSEQTPRSQAFCSVAIEQPTEVMVVPDARLDPRFRDNPLVTGEPRIRFYAGAPLLMPDGQALGTLCVIDRQARDFTEAQRQTLARLARQVVAQLELRKQQTELQLAVDRYQKLFDHTLDGVLQTRPGGDILSANPAACAMLGMSVEEMRRAGVTTCSTWTTRACTPCWTARQREGQARGELRMRRADGSPVRGGDHLGALPGPGRAVAQQHRVSRHHRAPALGGAAAGPGGPAAQAVPACAGRAVPVPHGRPTGSSACPSRAKACGPSTKSRPRRRVPMPRVLRERMHPDDLPMLSETFMASARTLQPWHCEFRMLLPEQGLRWRQGDAQPERLEDGSIVWYGFITDITERKEAEAHTFRLAYFDALTGLPNRSLLRDRTEQALALARRNHQYGAVMFVDLDNFKQINDARGHSVGDHLLTEVAQRLQRPAARRGHGGAHRRRRVRAAASTSWARTWRPAPARRWPWPRRCAQRWTGRT